MNKEQIKDCLDHSYYVFFTLVIMESLRAFNTLGSVGVLSSMAGDLVISVPLAYDTLVLPYMAGLVLGQLFLGTLSDRYGRVAVFMVFINIYAVASLLCTFFDSLWVLASFRALAGLASAIGQITVRALLNDFCTLTQGGIILSKVRSYSFLFTGLAMLLFESSSFHLGWRSFFTFNTIYCCMVSAISSYLLLSLSHRPDPDALGYNRLVANFFHTLGKSSYRVCCGSYVLVTVTMQVFLFYLRVIIMDYFNKPESWLVYNYILLLSFMGFLAMLMNTFLMRRYAILDIIKTTSIVTLGVVIWMYFNFYFFEGSVYQLPAYLLLLYMLVVGGTLTGFNLFILATQSLRNSTLGGGFIAALTISIFTAANLLVEAFLSWIEIGVQHHMFIFMILVAVINCINITVFAYPKLKESVYHPINMRD